MKDHYSASPLLFYITQCRSKSTRSKLTGVSFEELRVRNSTKEELSVSNI
ncbi:hypothetical protein Bca101_012099 [Brassica carinata]